MSQIRHIWHRAAKSLVDLANDTLHADMMCNKSTSGKLCSTTSAQETAWQQSSKEAVDYAM
jgi:hypothetical protein